MTLMFLICEAFLWYASINDTLRLQREGMLHLMATNPLLKTHFSLESSGPFLRNTELVFCKFKPQCDNWSPHVAAYIHCRTGWLLVQITACHLLGTKPLSKQWWFLNHTPRNTVLLWLPSHKWLKPSFVQLLCCRPLGIGDLGLIFCWAGDMFFNLFLTYSTGWGSW